MIIRKADSASEAGQVPSTALLAAMGLYMGRLVGAGVLRGGEGLLASTKGVRVTFDAGQPTVTAGPFGPAADLVAGFAIIEVAGLEAAIDWARQWPAIDANGAARLEVRQIAEAGDFGESFTPELQHAEDAMRATIALGS